MARVGEQVAATWKLEKVTPRRARLSMWGVEISLPKAPISPKPQSSATSTTILGGAATAWTHHAACTAARQTDVHPSRRMFTGIIWRIAALDTRLTKVSRLRHSPESSRNRLKLRDGVCNDFLYRLHTVDETRRLASQGRCGIHIATKIHLL